MPDPNVAVARRSVRNRTHRASFRGPSVGQPFACRRGHWLASVAAVRDAKVVWPFAYDAVAPRSNRLAPPNLPRQALRPAGLLLARPHPHYCPSRKRAHARFWARTGVWLQGSVMAKAGGEGSPLGTHSVTSARKMGRLRCHKRPKSREETPNAGSDSAGGLGGALPHTP
jgi:hypothetical protein